MGGDLQALSVCRIYEYCSMVLPRLTQGLRPVARRGEALLARLYLWPELDIQPILSSSG